MKSLRRRIILLSAGLWITATLAVSYAQNVNAPNPGQVNQPVRIVRIYHAKYAYNLLIIDAVQKDLKLDETQKSQIVTARANIARLRKKLAEKIARPRGGAAQDDKAAENPTAAPTGAPTTGPDQSKKSEVLPFDLKGPEHLDMQSLEDYIESVYSRILNPSQRNRLDQIDLQRAGTFAIFDNPTIAERLNVDEWTHQVWRVDLQKIEEEKQMILSRHRERISALQRSDDSDSEKATRKSALLQQRNEELSGLGGQVDAIINKYLSKRQKAAFKKMQGESFDTSTISPANLMKAIRSADQIQ